MKIFYLLFAILLSSCVTHHSIPKNYSGPTAVIKDTATKTGETKAEAFIVSKINGKIDKNTPMATPDGGGTIVTLQESKRTVTANQPITLTLYGGNIYAAGAAVIANRFSGKTRQYVTGDVIFTPQPNTTYKVNGVAGINSSSVWIEEDKTKRKVTKVLTKSKQLNFAELRLYRTSSILGETRKNVVLTSINGKQKVLGQISSTTKLDEGNHHIKCASTGLMGKTNSEFEFKHNFKKGRVYKIIAYENTNSYSWELLDVTQTPEKVIFKRKASKLST